MIASPHALAPRSARLEAIAQLATHTTTAPWTMSRNQLVRVQQAGLADDEVLHTVALSAFFGHLNRIALAVGVPLDYDVRHLPPATDPSTPPLAPAPSARVGRPALDLALRPATQTALTDWRDYAFHRDAPLTRRQRTFLARWVARWLGDGSISPPDDLTGNPLDGALRELAETVTLAPWRLGPSSFTALRANGFADAALFDVCATTSIAGVLSRIEIALVSLAT